MNLAFVVGVLPRWFFRRLRRESIVILMAVLLLLLGACTAVSSSPPSPTPPTPTLSATPIPYITRTFNQDVQGHIIMDYEFLTREQMIEQADAIFGGTVQTVSPVMWNQDSGEYWEIEIEDIVPEEQVVIEEVGPDGEIVIAEDAIPDELRTEEGVRLSTIIDALPVREIELVRLQPIVDMVGLDDTVTLTVLDQDAAVQEGDRIIVFARQTEFAWWDGAGPRRIGGPKGYLDVGRREVLTFITAPAASALWLGEDGLYHARYPAAEYYGASPISLAELIGEINAIRPEDVLVAPPEAVATPETTVTPTAVPSPTSTPPAVVFPPYECPIEMPDLAPSPQPVGSLRVAFVGPDGIHLWQAETGSSDLIYPAGDVTALKMSDDGERIAFTRSEGEGLLSVWVMDGDGGHARLLVTAADLKARHAPEKPGYVIPRRIDWMPGSHTLAYTAIGHEGGLLATFYDGLQLIDVDTGAITELLPTGSGGDFFFAPDGRTVAIVNDTSLSLLERDGGNYRRDILAWKALGLSHEYYRPQPAWMPNSRSLLLPVSNAKDNIDAAYNPDASSTLWRVFTDGSPPEPTTLVGAPLWVSISPDRSQVAFVRTADASHSTRELRIAASDNDWNIVYAGGDVGLNLQNWLPDSSGFVFRVSTEAPLLGRLCQRPVPLPLPETPGSFVRRIEWIDPQRFLFTVDEPAQLYLGNLDGTQTLIGPLREEYFFGVGALAAFDSYSA